MSSKAYSGFIDLKYFPTPDDLVCEFFLEPEKGASFETACNAIAGESSIGTWTEVSTMPAGISKLAPKVFYINKALKIAKIAYPLELFEAGNIPQLLSSIAGNIFGMKIVENLRLLDIEFPKNYIKHFKGPVHGIEGIRKLMKVPKRPLCGTIIKPKLGLNAKEHSQVAFNAWLGGCDFVKDDENLTNQNFNKFEERLKSTLKARDRAEFETGEKKCYFPNITAETKEMLHRAKIAHDFGSEYVMVDILTVGFAGLQSLREANEDLNLVLHAHRAMHAALTRNRKHGISMMIIAKLCRLIGLDQVHIGTAVGKMEGPLKEIQFIEEAIEQKIMRENLSGHVLEENWYDLKPIFAVCSGGLHPALVPKLVKVLGNNIIIQAGGGIHGHPKGTIAGAKAMRQSIDAVMQGLTLQEFAKKNKELSEALKKWKV